MAKLLQKVYLLKYDKIFESYEEIIFKIESGFYIKKNLPFSIFWLTSLTFFFLVVYVKDSCCLTWTHLFI